MTKNNRFSPTSEKGHFDGLVDEGRYLRQSLLYKQILPRPVRRSFSEGGTPSWPKTSVFSVHSVAKNLFNLRNLLLINDLRLYNCREKITDVMQSLQISPFLTNKANFQKSQMNVTDLLTINYEKMDTWSSGKNKANSNPIQSQYKPKTNPIQSQYKANTKPIQTQCLSAISVADQRRKA